MFAHEQVLIRRGERSGLPIIVAVHSTALGIAVGGCRLWRYPQWGDGVADALRLSEAMTLKCAIAGIAHGGGKTVVALPDGRSDGSAERGPETRRALLHDVGDAISALDGRYATGPDVGTDSVDMATIAERTSHVFCRPADQGGSGETASHTATGVLAAVRATCEHVFGSDRLSDRRIGIVGLGHVGADLAHRLAAAGASLVVADIDPTRRALAGSLGATWTSPDEVMTAEVDVLVPAALGGVLTTELVPRLRCVAIAGPANNQLAEPDVAALLHRRGICWAPDYVVSAGGVIYAIARELHAVSHDVAQARLDGIADTLAEVFVAAERDRITPDRAARDLAEDRLRRAGGRPVARPPGTAGGPPAGRLPVAGRPGIDHGG